MSAVEWLELRLSGFGPLADGTFTFPRGLGVLVAPNESGKSTAVAGLMAVLFGLPTSNDPASPWGTERFRSYTASTRFEGRLTFSARDGHSYEIRREFAEHRVELRRTEPGREETLFSGKHNPGARKTKRGYAELLEELIGIGSVELFRDTFCAGQPLSGHTGISQEVAALLAGSGGGTHVGALQFLKSAVENLTLRTGDLGMTPRNGRKERRLEQLEAEIESLKLELEQGRQAADGLRELQEQRSRLEGELEAAREERERARLRSEGVGAWLDAEREYTRAQRAHSALKHKLEQCRVLEAELRELERPSAAEQTLVQRDWSYVDGSAHGHLAARREDAGEVLEEFALYREALERLERAERAIEPFYALQTADEALLADLADYTARRRQLQEELETASEHLRQLQAQIERNDPDVGFEAVVALSPDDLARLEERARAKPLSGPIAGALTLVAGLLIGWLGGLTLPLLVIVPLAAAALAFLLADQTAGKRVRQSVQAARATLAEHRRWRERVERAGTPPDLGPNLQRVEAARTALQQFEERTAPFLHTFPQTEAAVTAFRQAASELTGARQALNQVTAGIWGTAPEQVPAADPIAAGGAWARAAAFAQRVDRDAASVAELVDAVRNLEGHWDVLAADARAWDERERARAQREAALAGKRGELQAVLRAENAADLQELSGRVDDLHNLAMQYLDGFVQVCARHPELPDVEAREEGRARVVAAAEEYRSEHARAEATVRGLETKVDDLRDAMSMRQGGKPVNIADLELRIGQLTEERAAVKLEIEAYALAYGALEQAGADYQSQYLDRLAQSASESFAAFSGVAGRRIALGSDFNVKVVEPGGAVITPDRLSQGAQDQLALALRIAVADMISENVKLPFILDDPFQNCDEARLGNIRAALEQIAGERQVVLLTHDADFAAWGESVELERSRPLLTTDNQEAGGERAY